MKTIGELRKLISDCGGTMSVGKLEYRYRKKRQELLAKTPIWDADGKLARCDGIELYLLRQS